MAHGLLQSNRYQRGLCIQYNLSWYNAILTVYFLSLRGHHLLLPQALSTDVPLCLVWILKNSDNPFRVIWCLHKNEGCRYVDGHSILMSDSASAFYTWTVCARRCHWKEWQHYSFAEPLTPTCLHFPDKLHVVSRWIMAVWVAKAASVLQHRERSGWTSSRTKLLTLTPESHCSHPIPYHPSTLTIILLLTISTIFPRHYRVVLLLNPIKH